MQDRDKKKAVSIIVLAISILAVMLAVVSHVKTERKSTAEAIINGKPTAPITIHYQLPDRAEIGREIPVIIKFTADAAVENLALKVTAPEGLEMVPEILEREFGDQPVNFTGQEEVVVILREEGALYLNVFVSGRFGNMNMVRSAAVPVYVGKDPLKHLRSVGQEKVNETGEKIISMPAEEN